MLSVTKIFHFEACHHLPNYKGKCNQLHGHSYKLEVTVETVKFNQDTGMVIDFNELKDIITQNVIDNYDHSYLNNIFKNPTVENMVCQIASDLILFLPKDVRLKRLKLWETHNSYAEFELE